MSRGKKVAPVPTAREISDLERVLELLRRWSEEQESPSAMKEREVTLSFKGGHVRVSMTEGFATRAHADQGETPMESSAAVEALAAGRNALRKLSSEWWI